MVDPQWDIWYWGSKWNLHTVCWSAVGCEWGTTSVYFGITYVCFIPNRLPVFAVEPQYLLQIFYFCQKYHLKNTYKILKKKFMLVWNLNGVYRTNIDYDVNVFHLRFSLYGSLMDTWELLMQTCWPPLSDHWSVQPTSHHLSGFVFYGCLKALSDPQGKFKIFKSGFPHPMSVPRIKHDYSYKIYQHINPHLCKIGICKFLFSLWSLVN